MAKRPSQSNLRSGDTPVPTNPCDDKSLVTPYYIRSPTASEKSAFAIEFAKKRNGEIVNADAFQLYQGLEIISAAPSAAEPTQLLTAAWKSFLATYEKKHRPTLGPLRRNISTAVLRSILPFRISALPKSAPFPLPPGRPPALSMAFISKTSS